MPDTRFPALTVEQMNTAQRAVFEEIASGPRGGVRGPFIPLLHNPALAKHVQALGEYLRFNTHIPDELLEIVILVTARHWRCGYEWYAHEKLARKAGVPDRIITAIGEGHRPEPMSVTETIVHDFAVETLLEGTPGDAVYTSAVATFGRDGALDLLALCGYYSTLALILNTARLPIPSDAHLPFVPR